MQIGATKVEKYKILIVEDDIVFAEATKTRLLEMGYLVSDTVTSAEDAIRSVRDDPPDLVLMDIVLNGEMDGIAGMVLSAALIAFFNKNGIDLSAMSKGLGAFGFDPRIYPFIKRELYINLTIMILCTGILSAIMPARKALKLKPVEAIRIE